MACICSFTFYFGDPYKRAEDMFWATTNLERKENMALKTPGFYWKELIPSCKLFENSHVYIVHRFCLMPKVISFRLQILTWVPGYNIAANPPLSLHKLMVCILWWTREWIWRKCIVFFWVFLLWKIPVSQTQFAHLFSAITTFNTKSIILAIDSHLISEYYFNFE